MGVRFRTIGCIVASRSLAGTGPNGLAAHPCAEPRSEPDCEGAEVDPKEEGALLERSEASVAEIEELRPLLAEARERGYVTFEALASSLEEVDVTKEQLRDLRTYLLEQGIDLL